MKLRLYQFLARSGLIKSKKEAEEIIQKGEIMVNKKPIKNLNYFVDTKKDAIRIDNQSIKIKKEKLYFILNKPCGIETTKENILKFIKSKDINEELKNTIFPVGRLDKDSEGMIILTNDGILSEQLLNPNNHIKKTYQITAEKEITKEQLNQLKQGIEIQMEENGRLFKYLTKPCLIEQINKKNKNNEYKIIITEGKKRQIRRMLEAINNKVLTLKRIQIGDLRLKNLREGFYKPIKKEDII